MRRERGKRRRWRRREVIKWRTRNWRRKNMRKMKNMQEEGQGMGEEEKEEKKEAEEEEEMEAEEEEEPKEEQGGAGGRRKAFRRGRSALSLPATHNCLSRRVSLAPRECSAAAHTHSCPWRNKRRSRGEALGCAGAKGASRRALQALLRSPLRSSEGGSGRGLSRFGGTSVCVAS